MTTGINIGADAQAQFDYVARLAAAGTAALAVDTGTTLAEVPAGVLTAGDRLGLPVLEVPPSTPFIAITRTVIDAVRADELRAVQRVVDGQEVLARVTLRGGIPGVVEALAERLGGTVLVVGTDGTVLAAAGTEQDRLCAVLADSAQAPAARRGGAYVTGDADAYVSVQNLRAAQPLRGQLAVRTVAPMSDAQRLLVAHAVSLISIALEKPAGVAEAEQRLRTAATHALLRGSGLVDDGMLRYFGFEPHADVVVVLLHDVGPLLAAQRELGRQLAATGPYLMAPLGDEIAIVVPSGERRRIDGLTSEPAHPLTGGVSDAVRVGDIPMGLEQARIAGQADPERLSAFADHGTFGLLLGGAVSPNWTCWLPHWRRWTPNWSGRSRRTCAATGTWRPRAPICASTVTRCATGCAGSASCWARTSTPSTPGCDSGSRSEPVRCSPTVSPRRLRPARAG